MVTLKVKSRSGQINELQVEALLEVDGTPYRVSPEDVRDAMIHLDARVQQLEGMISRLIGAGLQQAAPSMETE